MTIEVCCDTVETAIAANELGAQRIELCSALLVGGLTPSFGLIKACVKATDLEVHVMIRHQEGDFILDQDDLIIMKNDIEMAAKAGAKGIVFGCVNSSHELDYKRCQQLIDLSKQNSLEVTFHRAFDFLKSPFQAIDQLVALNCDRILTSGQAATAIEGIDKLADLVKYSNRRIEIMAGSGINVSNALKLKRTGVNALHFTAHKKKDMPLWGMGHKSITDRNKMEAIINLFR